MTLKLINASSRSDGEQLQRERFGGRSCSTVSNMTSQNKDSACPPEATERESCVLRNITEQQQRAGYQDTASEASSLSSHCRIGDSACLSSNTDGPVAFPDRQCHTHAEMEEKVNLTSQQLVLHDKRIEQQLACASPNNQFSMLSTIEKSVMEQTRSNDLKTFEISLIMKKMQLKERELELHSNANILERWKLSMGISKASFKAEKFKTQLQDSGQVELLKKCLDFLVGGIIIMLSSLAYGTYVYSHRRIVEATKACSPYTVRSNLIVTPPKKNEKQNRYVELIYMVFQHCLFTERYFYVFVSGFQIQIVVDAKRNVKLQLRFAAVAMPIPSLQSHVVWFSSDHGHCLSTYSEVSVFSSDDAHHFHTVALRGGVWLCWEVLHRHVGGQWISLADVLGILMLAAFLVQYLLFDFVYYSQRAYRSC